MNFIINKIFILFCINILFLFTNPVYSQKEILFENEEIVVKFSYEDTTTFFFNKKEKYMLWGENYWFYNYIYTPFKVELLNKNHSDSTLLFMLSAGKSYSDIRYMSTFFILLNKNNKTLYYVPLSDHSVLNNPTQRDDLARQITDYSAFYYDNIPKEDYYYYFDKGEFYLEIKWHSFSKTPERVVYKKYKQLEDKTGLLYFFLIEHTDTKPD